DRSYDVIHINTGSFFTLFLCSLVSKLRGKKAKVIAHSHSVLTYCGAGQLSTAIAKPLWKYVADYYFACSLPAGEYMFPQKIIKSNRFKIIRNAIDSDKFVYNKKVRQEYRDLLGVNEELLIGHVGRFVEAKNHKFLIRVFQRVYEKYPNAKLVLVGAGELEEEVRQQVRSLGLEHVVLFLGQRRDVHKIMQALDILLLPSLREGLGVVAIEAQAAGLPVLTSTAVPLEAKVTDLFFQLPLDAGADKWADIILEFWPKQVRGDTQQEIIKSGYDIKSSAKQLEEFYKTLDMS
ncbi:MAG: glycosyltransferase family 1 protein, partial [Bacteroidales bacterium]|nr:glycosyltransferase family 1 protein [Bacteroidales bacterium]